MHIKQKEKDGVLIVSLSGEMTIHTDAELEKTFKQILKSGSTAVILNFKEVEYIDSVGLAVLIEFSKDLDALHRSVVLSDLSLKIRSIFDITRLEKAFRLFETEEDALRGVS